MICTGRQGRTRGGFSLVELLVVTTILLLLFGGIVALIKPDEEMGGDKFENLTSLEILHGVKIYEILFGASPPDVKRMVSSKVLNVVGGDVDNIILTRNEEGVLDVVFQQ